MKSSWVSRSISFLLPRKRAQFLQKPFTFYPPSLLRILLRRCRTVFPTTLNQPLSRPLTPLLSLFASDLLFLYPTSKEFSHSTPSWPPALLCLLSLLLGQIKNEKKRKKEKRKERWINPEGVYPVPVLCAQGDSLNGSHEPLWSTHCPAPPIRFKRNENCKAIGSSLHSLAFTLVWNPGDFESRSTKSPSTSPASPLRLVSSSRT